MKQRIWELDALRGICILGMLAVHLIYDLVELYGFWDWQYPPIFRFLADYGSIIFLLISGICVTLGSKAVKRGLTVLACGILCTAVTGGMALLALADSNMVIWFGILHCLGCCMLVWSLLKQLPTAVLATVAAVLVAAGLLLNNTAPVNFPWLIPLGICPPWFDSPDYFPLMPNLGYFLLGTVLGRTLYRRKVSLLPASFGGLPFIRFLRTCGRCSLHIYLLHQPVFFAVCLLLSLIL